jgi:hypothetical protein
MDEWRVYRSMSRSSVGVRVAIAALCLVVVVVELGRSSVAAAVGLGVVWLLLFAMLGVRALQAGVYETAEGVRCIAGGYAWGSTTLAWADLREVGYSGTGLRETVVATARDGRRRVLRGARRRMRWDDGSTDDFAALLQSRSQQFAQSSA